LNELIFFYIMSHYVTIALLSYNVCASLLYIFTSLFGKTTHKQSQCLIFTAGYILLINFQYCKTNVLKYDIVSQQITDFDSSLLML